VGPAGDSGVGSGVESGTGGSGADVGAAVGPTGSVVSSRAHDTRQLTISVTASHRKVTAHVRQVSRRTHASDRCGLLTSGARISVCRNDNSVSDIISTVSRFTRGGRGELYVAAQFVLLALVIAGPTHIGGWPLDTVAVVSTICGALLLVAGTRQLGRQLTPLPYPKDDGALVDRGVYRYARHPIYGGLMLLALGWSLRRDGGLALAYAGLLAGLLFLKSRVEERWLLNRYPRYAAYRARTRRFIPWFW
jgi:protein-S-isoprenylcysteine O-methyltransferase Ste14